MGKKSAANQTGHAFFTILALQVTTLLQIAGHILAITLAFFVDFFPSKDVLDGIVSSFAEITAGLYGITLAGYTFFLSRIDALMAADTTLDYIVDSVKKRFKYMIWGITSNVFMMLLVTLVLMYLPAPENGWMVYAYRLASNEYILFLICSIIMILYYSISVVDPNCLTKEAAKLKKRISKETGTPGSVAEFISLYDQIEAKCSDLIPRNVLSQLHEHKGKRFAYTIALLAQLRPDLKVLLDDLTRVHRYYVCTVNCEPLTVTQEMCDTAQSLLTVLEQTALPRN